MNSKYSNSLFKAKKILSSILPGINCNLNESTSEDTLKIVFDCLMDKDFSAMNESLNPEPHRIELFFGSIFTQLKTFPVITTERLYELYDDFLPPNSLILPDGEDAKSEKFLFEIYDFLLKGRFGRTDTIKVFGGGSLTDICSFALSTFKRGINFELYPTTLLSQIDASIGGKNAINYNGIKNLIGTVSFPNKVVIDPLTLISLSEKEYVNGLVESLKIFLITGKNIEFLKNNLGFLKEKNMYKLKTLIIFSVKAKLKIALSDLQDKGARRVLNFGHTFGHVFESVLGMSHGLSVLWGMQKESMFFYKTNRISKDFYCTLTELFKILVDESLFDMKLPKSYKEILFNDKKASNSTIIMPILKGFGDFYFEKFSFKEVVDFLDEELTF